MVRELLTEGDGTMEVDRTAFPSLRPPTIAIPPSIVVLFSCIALKGKYIRCLTTWYSLSARLELAGEMNRTTPHPHYKLIYFNARGRAEHIRLIFAYAGVEYEDVRIPKEKWSEYRKRTPFGMLPILEIDGRIVSQSNAIGRHLARKYGLSGRDEWEALQCDVLVDTLGDLKQVLWQYRTELDPIKKEERKAKLMKETIPFYLAKFERVVAENSGLSVGKSITWCDFVFAVSLENFELIFGKTSLDQYPALKGLKEKVYSLPSIAAWVAKRPATES